MSATPGNGVIDPLSATNGSGPSHSGACASPGASGSVGRRPEIAVGAAFAGGFLLAVLLRRIRS